MILNNRICYKLDAMHKRSSKIKTRHLTIELPYLFESNMSSSAIKRQPSYGFHLILYKDILTNPPVTVNDFLLFSLLSIKLDSILPFCPFFRSFLLLLKPFTPHKILIYKQEKSPYSVNNFSFLPF